MSPPPVVLRIVGDNDDAAKKITDSTRRMTLMQIEASKLNDAINAGTVSAHEASSASAAAARAMTDHHAATIAATRSMGVWAALQAEAAGGVGEHSLAIGRLGYRLEHLTAEATGTNSAVGLLGATFLKFGAGDVYTIAILGGLYAIVEGYKLLTHGANEAEKATDDLIKKLREKEDLQLAGGVEGKTQKAAQDKVDQALKAIENFNARSDPLIAASSRLEQAPIGAAAAAGDAEAKKKELERLNDDLRIAIVNRDALLQKSAENQDRAFTSDLAALIQHNHATAEERRNALILLKADEETLKKLSPTDLTARAALSGEIDKLSNALFPKSDEKRAESEFNKMLARANERGALAQRLAYEAYTREEKSGKDLQALRDRQTEDAVKAMGLKDVAEGMAIIDAHDRAVQEINDRQISGDLKAQLIQAQNDAEVAALADLNRRLDDENEKHRISQQAADDKAAAEHKRAVEHRTQVIASVEKKMASDLIDTRLSFGQRLLRAALEPEIAFLEAKAMSQFEQAAADSFIGDWGGAAAHVAAGLALETGAGLVGQISGGGGGGRGGSAAGGGSQAGLGASLATSGGESSQPLQIELVLITKDQNEREVSRTSQMIQRLNDRNVPVRVTL
jgi:hypothetical protein